MDENFRKDIDAIGRIAAVPTILDVICRATGMGFAAVARVTGERWIACQVLDNIHFGLPAGGELKVETTLCHEVRQLREVIVIDNVAEDPVYADHHTPLTYGLQSYISVPIILPDGTFFGTLCAIDPRPANLNNPQILGTFKLFAELIASHLDAQNRIDRAELRMQETAAASTLLEEFVAVLGHDLRNPLAAIDGGASILLRADRWTERTPVILRLMKNSVIRMSGLIDNVLDLARSRIAGGIELYRDAGVPLGPMLGEVVEEIRMANPGRAIDASIDIPPGVEVDHRRLAQLFSNLLGNAVAHGTADAPVRVEGGVDADGTLRLSVANTGQPIPPEVIDHLFKPFHRSKARKNAEGLGLGLYIASQIAAAHGGRIEVNSTAAETRFTFRMPVRDGAGPSSGLQP